MSPNQLGIEAFRMMHQLTRLHTGQECRVQARKLPVWLVFLLFVYIVELLVSHSGVEVEDGRVDCWFRAPFDPSFPSTAGMLCCVVL